MFFQKKVMILSDIQSGEGIGIVKLTSTESESTATVTLHSFAQKDYTLLLKINDRLLAYNINDKAVLNLNSADISGQVDSLLLAEGKPVLYGSTSVDKYRCFNLLDEYIRLSNTEPQQKNSQQKIKIKPLSTDEETILEKSENQSDNVENSFNIISEKNECEINSSTFAETPSPSFGVAYEGEKFYLAVKPQLDEMFTCYPADNELNNLIPNSKWVRVSTPDDYYVVGIIFELDEPKYICYGIHGEYKIKPPDDIYELCDWLPMNLSSPESEGYWLIYQDAKNGKTVKKSAE